MDSPEAKQVLTFMQNGIKDGAVSHSVSTYMEEESRRAFEAGKASARAAVAVRVRSWPNQSPIKGKFQVTTLPGWNDKPASGVIGGYNLAVNIILEEPGHRARVRRVRHPAEAAGVHGGEDDAPADAQRGVRRAGVQKVMPFANKLAQGDRAGPPAPALAGLPADQRGDLQERLQRSLEWRQRRLGAEEGKRPDQPGVEAVLAHGDRGRDGRSSAQAALRPLGAPPRGADDLAGAARHPAGGRLPDRVRDLALAPSVQPHPQGALPLVRLHQLQRLRSGATSIRRSGPRSRRPSSLPSSPSGSSS